MNNLTCPYCDAVQRYPEEIDTSDASECQCRECEKIFTYTVEYYPSFLSEKAECLNGGAHNYKKIDAYVHVTGEPVKITILRCKVCGVKSESISGA